MIDAKQELLDAYAEALGQVVLGGAELERSLAGLHEQLLRSKRGMVQATGPNFDRALNGCWAILKAFPIPRADEMAATLTDCAAVWDQRTAAVRAPQPTDDGRALNGSTTLNQAVNPTSGARTPATRRLRGLAGLLREQAARVQILAGDLVPAAESF